MIGLIEYGETTLKLSSRSENSSRVGTSTPECSGVRGSTARPCVCNRDLKCGNDHHKNSQLCVLLSLMDNNVQYHW